MEPEVKLTEKQAIQPTVQQPTVHWQDLAVAAKPLVDQWAAVERTKADAEREVALADIKANNEQARRMSWMIFSVLGGFLTLAGVLFLQDRAADAMALIQTIVVVVGSFASGYGIARVRGSPAIEE